MRSLSYQQLKEKAPTKPIDLATAITWLKENSRQSFDETIELHFRLGVNAEKSDQMVRGQVKLPAGAVTKPDIVVFTDSEAEQKEVIAAGAKKAGGEKLINEISSSGTLKADITIATPDIMPKVAKTARTLGPKGLMPNPKTGTVSDKPAELVKELLSGKISFKMDQLGNIHQAVGKASWDNDQIATNAQTLIQAVKSSKPASSKGEFLKAVFIKSTMSPSLRITV
jgi:large subunit ribosomal protein L1